MTFLLLLKTGIIPLGVIVLLMGGPEPICSPDDPRAQGWDYEQIEIDNAQDCNI